MTTAPTRVDAWESVASTEDLARVTVRYLAGALPSSPLRDRPVSESTRAALFDELRAANSPSLITTRAAAGSRASRAYCAFIAEAGTVDALRDRVRRPGLIWVGLNQPGPALRGGAIWSRTARVSGSCLRDDIDAYVRACPRIASVLDGWVPGMIVDPVLVDRPVLWGVLVGALPRISRA